MTPLTNELFRENVHDIITWARDIAQASQGEYAEDKVLDAITQGGSAAWLVNDPDTNEYCGLCVAALNQYIEGRVLVVWGVAGVSHGMWQDFTEHWDRAAQENDCVAWEAKGRRGFLKTLAPHGVVEKYVTMRKTIKT